ncbi:MAG: hypothetical protein JNJ40_09435 [Bacteroidia bacterium]|nr:hypothetical protein [Bacteroidia bacterium]
MKDNTIPKPYSDWRTKPYDRAEDAAYTFGYHLINHCRKAGVESLPEDLNDIQREKVIKAIDVSLHNVLDLFEGFFSLESGKDHSIGYSLQVLVQNINDRTKEIERIEITGQDMSIGYWKWAKDNEFR